MRESERNNRTAIVVGASSGMGRATAKLLAVSGYHVLAAGRRLERLEALRSESENNLEIQECDATDRRQVENLIERAKTLWGRIDVLVYATGTNLPARSLERLTPDGWNELLATNLTGAYHCTQCVLPTMRQQKSGLIIYLSTGAVQKADVSGVAYQASKHGLTGLARGTRVEEQAHGIRTTLIFPGLCDTEILAKRPIPTPTDVLAQALQPEDVAQAVLFVASQPERCYIPELQLFPSGL